MKKITLIGMATLMLGISTINTGCMGSFALTKKLYGWNDGATGNKFLDNILFWILSWNIYGIFLTIDMVILNLVEFWTGSNPIAMAPGEKETQVVMGKDGNQYEITATQNRFDIIQMSGKEVGKQSALVYSPATLTWSKVENKVTTPLLTAHPETNKVEIFAADGSVKMVDVASVYANQLHN